MVSRLDYLEHFLDSVDFVISGRKGSISEDKWLVTNYNSGFYSVLEKHLINQDDKVRTETVMLLTALKERAAGPKIKDMRVKDNERVRNACLGYLTSMGEDDTLMTTLVETLEFKRGNEFRNAAVRAGTVGRADDIPILRRIYGQVDGEMRSQMRTAISNIIDRCPELKGKKELLLSVPVFPDERAFIKFLENGEDYLDVRYRNSVSRRCKVSIETHNNIVRGIRKIRMRLFNEAENLQHYSEELTEVYNRVVDLLAWAVDDLSSKDIVEDGSTDIVCARCGSHMIHGNDSWKCIECGSSK